MMGTLQTLGREEMAEQNMNTPLANGPVACGPVIVHRAMLCVGGRQRERGGGGQKAMPVTKDCGG